jgi:hypothetical protein
MDGKEDSRSDEVAQRGKEPVAEGQRSILRKALTSESFVEKIALLVFTAVLSGLIIPFLLAQYNSGASARQKSIDLARSKNDSILQAQAKLVEEFATIILTYETLALDISWYKTRAGKDENLYRKAFERYSDRIVDLLSSWRSLSARSQALTSPSVNAKITGFQVRVFTEQDTPLNALNRGKATEEQWEAQHIKNEEMLSEANALISEIMNDLGLSKSNLGGDRAR